MRVLGPLAFVLYRTRHFEVDTTLHPRTISCKRVKATPLLLLLFNTVTYRHALTNNTISYEEI